jgi:AraC-like DNA-binding protein
MEAKRLKINGFLPVEAAQHDDFQIVWVTSGTGSFCIDMERFLLSANTVYFVPPGRMQHMHPSGDVDGWVLSFNPDFLQLSAASTLKHSYKEMVAGYSRVIMLYLRENKAEGILANVLQEMIRESGQQQPFRAEVLSGLLHMFLIYLQRLAPARYEPIPSKKVELFNNFYSRLEKDFIKKRCVAEYATELSVTPNYLSEVVKRVSGYSASHHIQQRMVLEAKRLAMYSDANMKLIAYKLGFDDLSHFSKFFKNVAGMNFTEFRNSNVQFGAFARGQAMAAAQ